ncbi:MAG TPA: hypothetical protein VKB42_23115 [Dongiaceae bacterium]|nr:hypothetical protein [Dongiaceae bacterium]
MFMRWDVLAVAAAALIALSWLYRRDRERFRRLRGGFFSGCLDLFEQYRVVQDDVDFPVLTGRYRGHEVRLEPIVDHMTMRKLPSLWLQVSLIAPVPYQGIFDLLVRPRGTEFYSPSIDLAYDMRLPPGWPSDAALRSDDPARMPPLAIMGQHRYLFEDQRLKEMLVTPKGVRLVYQVQQAERAKYAVLRQIEFLDNTLPPALARRLLEATIAIRASLIAEAVPPT